MGNAPQTGIRTRRPRCCRRVAVRGCSREIAFHSEASPAEVSEVRREPCETDEEESLKRVSRQQLSSLSFFARLLCVSIRPASLSSPSISREYSRGRDASRRHGLKSPASGLYRHKLFQTRLLEGRRASQRSGRGRRHGRNAKESAMAQDFSGPNQPDGLLRALSIEPRR